MSRGHSTPLPLRIVAAFLVLVLALPPVAFANPRGAAVRHGQVRIQGGAGQLEIRQTTQCAVIDWESFSIDQGEVTRFIQPDASSAVLNRVRGSSASQIEGMLRANGRVYLINPNGILIGPNGSVDVAGFVASTLDPGDRAFLRGGSMRFSGASDAAVINLGSISALDGDVVLMGASVLNGGEIRAPRGTAALAAGNDILLAESGEERVFVRGSGGSDKAEGVTNTGNIVANIAELKAHGGNVYGIAVKNEGRVAATGVTRRGGQIFLSAGGGTVRSTGTLKARKSGGSGGRVKVDSGTTGKTEIGGTVDASGDSGSGGEIAILGNEIEVFDGALILNDGETMGGTTRIGGGRYGSDPALANAETVTVGNGALISADALGFGEGGEIVIFATDTATLNGSVSARGGAFGGNGGFIELSGRNRLFVPDLAGQVALSAPFGESGTLLLDPADINVIHGTGGGIMGTTMTDDALMSVLASFPVLIWTSDYGSGGNGDITFAADVNLFWSSSHSLNFQADRDFIVNGGAIINATGSGAFNVTATRAISVGSGASITTTNGNLTLSANTAGTTAGNFVGVDVNGGIVQSIGSGSVSVTGRGGNDASGNQIGVRVRNGGSIRGGTSGLVSVTGYGGNSTGSGNIGVNVFSSATTTISSVGANVQVTGTGGGGNASMGIEIGTGNSNGRITAGGLGTVTVHGTGGTQIGGAFLHGILMGSSTIDSTGGNVSVTGIGGIGSSASGDYTGIQLDDSTISAGGSGNVTVVGSAGTAASSQTLIGVDVRFTSQITSSGGNVSVTGTGGNTTNALLAAGAGIRLIGNGTITAGGTGSVNAIGTGVGGSTVGHEGIVINGAGLNTNLARIGAANGTTALTAISGNGASHALVVGTGFAGRITTGNNNLILINSDSMSVGSGGIISSGTGNTSVNTRTTGTLINLGGDDVLTGTPLTLGLTDAELDRFTAATLQIGNNSSGQITVGSALTHGNHLSLTTGEGVTINESIAMAANKDLAINALGTSTGQISLATANSDLSTTGSGAISLTTTRNIALANGSSVTTINGNLTLSANSAESATGNFTGVDVDGGMVQSLGTGSVSVTGKGGNASADFQRGVAIRSGGQILGGTTGTVVVSGTGRATASPLSNYNYGVHLNGSGSRISSNGASVSVTGWGGRGFNDNYGILVANNGQITSGGSGNVTVAGTGGNGEAYNNGISIFGGGGIASGGMGTVSVTATAGTNAWDGSDTDGLSVYGSGSSITSGGGDVFVTGYGGIGGEQSYGVSLYSSGMITSGGGSVTVTGEARNITNSNGYQGGVILWNSDTRITSGGGSVTVTGTGATGGRESYGVILGSAASITSSGSGTVSVTGTSGTSSASSEGVAVHSGANITSNAGAVSVTGYAGTATGVSSYSKGIRVQGTGSTITSGGGNLVVQGTGGIGPTENHGIWIWDGGQIIGSTGTLSVNGTGGSDSLPSGLNHGILIEGLGSRITGSGGNMTVTGIGGSDGGASHGVRLHDRGEIVYSGAGLLTVEGAAGIGGGFGISLSNAANGGAAIRSTGSGNILLIADSLDIASNTESIQTGANTVTIRQRTNGHLINLGGADDSTRLGLSDAELDRVTAGLVRIGNQNTGVFTVSSQITHGNSLALTSGDWFDVYEGITMSTDRNLTLTTTESGDGYISLSGSNAQLSATGTGTITLDVKRGIKIEYGGISTENGSLTLLANTADGVGNSSIGIELFDADLSTVNGAILLEGHPGPDTLTGDNDGIVISGGSSIAATGTGTITLATPRNIRLESASTISSLNGNISLTANQGTVPTPGSFSGIDLNAASISSIGTGTVSLSGRGGDGEGGQHGILLRGGASITTNARNLTLSGSAPDPLSSGLRIELAGLGAGGGTIQLTGNGGTTSVDSTNSSATIGSAADTILIRSNSGDVSILGRVQGADLQVQDYSGTESVDFALTNTSNDVDRINAFSNGTNGRVASLDFDDSDGFLITEFLGASGVLASGNVTLRSNLFSGSSVVIDRPVRSSGGNVLLRGLDVVIDGTQATATGSGSLTLEAGRAILVWDDSLLSVTNGAMRLEANRGEGSLEGNFTGITVLGSRLQSLGTGGISLSGAGGDGGIGSDFAFPGFSNPSSHGIRLDGGTVISSSDSSTNDLGIELYGDGGGRASDSVGVSIANADTNLMSAGRSILVEGWGGGDSSGQRNRGILFTGGLIQTANTGNVTLFGAGGAGVNENDGIQLDNGARVQVAGGDLTLDGYAGNTLGIGVMLGNSAGNLMVTGNGSATVKGTGTNAHGVFLGNSSGRLGGANADYVDVFSRGGDLTLRRETGASGNVFVGADFGDLFIEGEVHSGTGDIWIEGDNVTIDAPVTATDGDINVTFGDNGVILDGEPEDPLEITPTFDGTGAINDLLTAGGRVRYFGGDGTGDVLTFAGYTISEIDLDIGDLTDIENVIGTGSSNDRLQGPAVASNYQFTGPNQFNVGGVAFSAFENVLGGGGDDVFAFTGSASIDGALDGGSGMNRLDYSGYATGVVVDLPLGAASGIVGGFENITNFTGSGNIDTVTGPGSASIYTFTGIDSMQVGTVSVAGFENLIAGPLEDRFVFLPGSSLRGLLDGGFSPTPVNNILDYSGFGAPVTINLATSTARNLPGGFTGINRFQGSGSTRDLFSGPNSPTSYLFSGPNAFGTPDFQATGFEGLSGGIDSDTFVFAPNTSLAGNLSGGDGPGSDTLTYAFFGRQVTVNVGPNTASGIGGRFEGVERIVGSPGNDRFNFLNQSTINFVDGGTGTDLIEINDSNLRGDNTYDINANTVSRNPLYTFNNFEALRLFLGTGNNTVNSGFFPYTQFLHGGNGFNTLNLPGVTSLNGPSPIGNVHHFGFDAPRPGGVDTGGLLQLEMDQNNDGTDLDTGQDSGTENRFNIVDPATLNSQIAALGGAFSAAVVAQAVIGTVDGNSYLVLRPFSLDGSGLSPSNLGLAALNESLGVDANLELAAAIGFDGPVFLFNPDGPYSIDLSGVPADPAILTLLQESLSIAAAAELSAAIGLTLTVSITGADGIVPTGLDGSVPGQNVVLIFGDQLGDPAQAELNAAIAGGN